MPILNYLWIIPALPLLAAPGNVTSEPAVLTRGGELAIKPGDTEATGQAFARRQIETGEAAAPSGPTGADETNEEGLR